MPDQVRHDAQIISEILNYDTASGGRGCACQAGVRGGGVFDFQQNVMPDMIPPKVGVVDRHPCAWKREDRAFEENRVGDGNTNNE